MSTNKRLVIIGADAAGMSAASEARRLDRQLEIVALDRGSMASYSQCGMPYLVGGVVPDWRHLIARSVEEFAARNIAVRLGHEVVSIDPLRQILRVRQGSAGEEYEQSYDRLLIATGAEPVKPAVPGVDLEGVFGLDVLEDALALEAYLQQHHPQRAVIVGGGYIGLEMAENLVRLGLQVWLIQRNEQLFPAVDGEIAHPLMLELERQGSTCIWVTASWKHALGSMVA
jgi:NADPH-dependent 2,4-dienoyl-CoA reductase/sulfur reductase-like enzyme